MDEADGEQNVPIDAVGRRAHLDHGDERAKAARA